MRNYNKVIDLETKFESGGESLAITDSGKYCAAAAYVRSGITLYDAQTGMIIWNTKSIKHIQKIKFTKKDAALAVSNDSG